MYLPACSSHLATEAFLPLSFCPASDCNPKISTWSPGFNSAGCTCTAGLGTNRRKANRSQENVNAFHASGFKFNCASFPEITRLVINKASRKDNSATGTFNASNGETKSRSMVKKHHQTKRKNASLGALSPCWKG